jgi:hypothetical protein
MDLFLLILSLKTRGFRTTDIKAKSTNRIAIQISGDVKPPSLSIAMVWCCSENKRVRKVD